MIELLKDLPDNVVGLKAKTPPTQEEYTEMLSSITSATLQGRGRIRLIFSLGPLFSTEEARAMWADAELGLKHIAAWEKVAAVSDFAWLPASSRTFGTTAPGQIRVFPSEKFSEAMTWVKV